MIIDDLIELQLSAATTALEWDALQEDDALVDAALIATRIDHVRGVIALIFDCRNALQARQGNTAVLVVEQVERFASTTPPTASAWARVDSWKLGTRQPGFRVDAHLGFHGALSITGGAAHYFIGDATQLDDAPPDLTRASSTEIVAEFATWASPFELIARSSHGHVGLERDT